MLKIYEFIKGQTSFKNIYEIIKNKNGKSNIPFPCTTREYVSGLNPPICISLSIQSVPRKRIIHS